MKKHISRCVAIVICTLLCCCSHSDSQPEQPKPQNDERVLTLSVQQGISEEAQAGLECFAQKVSSISNGALKISMKTCSDPLEQLDNGSELVFGLNEEFARANGNFNSYTSPFYFYDYKHLTLTLNSQSFYDIIRNTNLSLMNAMPIAAFYDGNRAIASSRNEVFDTVGQFEGRTVNVIDEQPMLEVVLKHFKAETKERSQEYILLNFGKNRDNAVMECDTMQLGELPVPEKKGDFYISKTFHRARINWLMMSQTAHTSLNEQQLAVITEACAYAIAKNDNLVLEKEEENFAKIREKGALIVTPSYGEFAELSLEALATSAAYSGMCDWEQHNEVRLLAIKQR